MLSPQTTNLDDYQITYFNKEELRIVYKEIFQKEIYRLPNKQREKIKNNKQSVILDCGAFLGLSTIYFRKEFQNSKIISFEPNPNIFPLLEENIYGNGINNVELVNKALSKKSGTSVWWQTWDKP